MPRPKPVAQRQRGHRPWPLAMVSWAIERAGPWGAAALAATLVLLLLHAARYVFLTDDAFISFRYARNLAHGHGLVFNPGFERVEGYSNFLWVMLLAVFDAVGLAPERMSHVLSFAATVALWGLVAWFSLRERDRIWIAIVPALFLAATRSVAVWSTGGLETRLFEALALAGALRLLVELDARIAERPTRSHSAWLFGLAALTRPDGLLLAGCAFAAAVLVLRARRPEAVGGFLKGLLPFVAMVAAHFAFRLAYYGDLLPNTYYAKVGGRTWWSSGLVYLAAFTLEYAAYLWLPLLVAAWVWHRRKRTLHVPIVFTAMVLPHAIYVASIGGDHFEYRPLDLYFPLAFLLMADGARQLAGAVGARARTVAVAVWLGVCLVGVWQLPAQNRAQMPAEYIPGFPGWALERRSAREFLDPARDPLYRLPGLRTIAEFHRALIRELTRHYVALRQEEHRGFLATMVPEGKRLRALVESRVLPADLHVALACVGAIPYYSGLHTLDRLGLTDRTVAHRPFSEKGFMAHDKHATRIYAEQRGVDLWALEGVHLVCNVTSDCMLATVREAKDRQENYLFAMPVGGGDWIMAELPQGLAHAQRRMPRLRFHPMNGPAFVQTFLEQGIAAYRERLERDPDNGETRYELAFLLLAHSDFDAARTIFESLAPGMGDRYELWVNLAECYDGLRDPGRARAARMQAVAAAERGGDAWAIPGLKQVLDQGPSIAQ